MVKTKLLQIVLLTYAAFFFPYCASQESKNVKTIEKPNIIFILADDLGYGDLGCYGQQKIQTPHLDQMAKNGVQFTQAYSGAPVCAPARSVLMTGLHGGHTPIRGNRSLVDRSRVPLPDSAVTVAEVLKDAGYTTGMFGKWGLGEPGTEGHPNNQGFDEFYGFLNQRRAHDYYPEYAWHNRDTVRFKDNEGGAREIYVADWYFERSIDFVEQHHKRPFFAYLPIQLPHNKYQIPDLGLYDTASWTGDEKVYAAMVTKIDSYVGRLLQTLDSLGITENTIVFFSSDNGPAKLSEHGEFVDPAFFGSRGGLRGIKRDVYEAGIRIPMLVQWKGTIAEGAVSDYPWAFHDILPTVLDLSGSKKQLNTDGLSVLPALKGEKPAIRDYLYWEFFGEGSKRGLFLQALRQGNWKMVSGYNEAVELYDLSEDPAETLNLCKEYPDKCNELQNLISKARTESKHWPVLQ